MKAALERAEITQLSNTDEVNNDADSALERAEITQLSNIRGSQVINAFGFRTSRNYTALKRISMMFRSIMCFRTSRNYTALKPQMFDFRVSSVLDC